MLTGMGGDEVSRPVVAFRWLWTGMSCSITLQMINARKEKRMNYANAREHVLHRDWGIYALPVMMEVCVQDLKVKSL